MCPWYVPRQRYRVLLELCKKTSPLSKFNGLTNDKFILYLKESEAKFYHRDNDFATFVEKLVFEKSKIKKNAGLEPNYNNYLFIILNIGS